MAKPKNSFSDIVEEMLARLIGQEAQQQSMPQPGQAMSQALAIPSNVFDTTMRGAQIAGEQLGTAIHAGGQLLDEATAAARYGAARLLAPEGYQVTYDQQPAPQQPAPQQPATGAAAGAADAARAVAPMVDRGGSGFNTAPAPQKGSGFNTAPAVTRHPTEAPASVVIDDAATVGGAEPTPMDEDLLLRDFRTTHGGPFDPNSSMDKAKMEQLRTARAAYPDATPTQLALRIYRGEFD